MELRVLGPLVVLADDGRDVTPRGPQQRRLLTALVAAAPDLVTVDALVDLLWPDGAPSANALQAQVSKIRRALGGTTIAGDSRGYALIPAAGDRIDVDDFERLVDAALRAVAAGDHGTAADCYASALALVRGTPLHDVADAEGFRPDATRLAALVAAARRGRADALLATGHLGEAEAELEAHVAASALDEGAWSALMVAQARQGRHGDALRTYQRARHVLAEELGIEPGQALRDVERRVLEQDPSLVGARPPEPARDPSVPAPRHAPAGRVKSRVPARLTQLVGRDDLLGAVTGDLDRHRLVTLLGPGGAGKTSAALELARRWTAGPAVVVELAPVGDPDAVAAEIAAGLGVTAADTAVPGVAATTFDRLVDVICGEQLLLVVDNCEHVVDPVAKLVHRLLEACGDLTVLATSREALSVPGERVVPLPPLAESAAVELFVERADAAARVALDDDGDVIAEICRRLDGLPLAIELAAARVRSMHPSEVLDRLDDRFALLSAGPRTLEPRQQTLRAVVDWSHDLLDDAERAVFRRLAVFAGGATLAAAEAVCADGEQVLESHVAGLVERLIDKSLVVVDRDTGTARYTMLQTLGEYARERLRASGEVERVHERHARWFARLVAPAQRGLLGREQRRWIDVVTAERENLRVALDVAMARGDAELALELTAPLGWYYYMIAQSELGLQALEDALSCPGMSDPAQRAIALAHYGWLAAQGPSIDVALEATGEAMALTASVDDAWVEAFVLGTRIMALFFAGRLDDIRRLVPELDDAATRSADDWALAIAALVRGEMAHQDGRPEEAEAAFWDSVRGFERVGDEFSLAITLTEAAEIAEVRGDYDHAVEMLEHAIRSSELVGFSGHQLGLRAHLGNVEALRGNLDLAEQMHLDLLAEIGDMSLPWLRATSFAGLAMISRRREQPDDARRWLDRAWETARTRQVPVVRAMVLGALGYTADQRGDAEEALRHQLEGLTVSAEHGLPRAVANALEGVAGALALSGDEIELRRAARLLGCADAVRRRSGGPMPPAERFDVDRAERRCRAAVGDTVFDEAFAEGAATAAEQLVDEVLGASSRAS